MKVILHIIVCLGMLFYTGTALGAMRIQTNEADTLSAEEKQQFLYYFYEAQRLIEKEAILPAWELIQFCHALNPNDAAVCNYMGVFLETLDKPEEALPYFQHAFDMQPCEYWYHYAAHLLRSKNQKQENIAIRNLEYVAAQIPKDEDIHTMLQKAYMHVGNYKCALKVQDNLDSIMGYNAMSAMQRYRINAIMDNTQQAIYEVERYLKEEPDNVQFQVFRLELYEQTYQPSEKMIEAYKAVLQYDSRNLQLMNNLAWHLCLLGKDLEQAEQLSRTTIMKEPTNPIYLDTYAWILYHQTKYNDAFFYIQRALENATPEMKKEVVTHYKAIRNKLK